MFFCPCQNPAPSYSAQQDAKPWCCQASSQLPKEKELIKGIKELRCQAPFPAQSWWIQCLPAGRGSSERLLLCPSHGQSRALPFPVSITGLAAGVSPCREAATLILLKAHHGPCSLVLYLFI